MTKSDVIYPKGILYPYKLSMQSSCLGLSICFIYIQFSTASHHSLFISSLCVFCLLLIVLLFIFGKYHTFNDLHLKEQRTNDPILNDLNLSGIWQPLSPSRIYTDKPSFLVSSTHQTCLNWPVVLKKTTPNHNNK